MRIETRSEIGHWEADTVICQGACVHTEVERTSRFMKARIIPTKSASDTVKAQYEIFALLHPSLRRTITLDSGTEFTEHAKLVESLGGPHLFR